MIHILWKRKRPLVLKALTVAAVVLLLLALWGCGRGREEEATQSTTATAGGEAGTAEGGTSATAGGGGMPMAGGGGMPMMGGGMAGGMGASGGTGAAPAGQQQPVQVVKLPPLVPNRPDPFQSLEPPVKPPPPPPPPPLPPPPPPVPAAPIVIRPKSPPPPTPPPPPPPPPSTPAQTRMAGVLWGDDVLGILVHQGEGYVVRPGELIEISTGSQPGEYMVVSITTESMLIRRADDPMAPVIRVPLQNTAGARTPPPTTGTQKPGEEETEREGGALPGMLM